MMHSVDMRMCINYSLIGTCFNKHFSFRSLCLLLVCHCEAAMVPFFLISACSWGSTILGSKPSISATRSAVFGSILPYVMKISYAPQQNMKRSRSSDKAIVTGAPSYSDAQLHNDDAARVGMPAEPMLRQNEMWHTTFRSARLALCEMLAATRSA